MLTFLMWAIGAPIAIWLYSLVGIGMYRVMDKWLDLRGGGEPLGAIPSLIWPIGIPIVVVVSAVCYVIKFAAWTLDNPLRIFTPLHSAKAFLKGAFKRKTKRGQMAPDIPRPTFVLAGVVGQHILKNFSSMKHYDRFEDEKWVVKHARGYAENEYELTSVVSGKTLSKDALHAEDWEELRSALSKAWDLHLAHRKNEKASAIQQEACAMLEDFSGTSSGVPINSDDEYLGSQEKETLLCSLSEK